MERNAIIDRVTVKETNSGCLCSSCIESKLLLRLMHHLIYLFQQFISNLSELEPSVPFEEYLQLGNLLFQDFDHNLIWNSFLNRESGFCDLKEGQFINLWLI